MREEKQVERIDEAMNDGKLTWDKPALKVFPIDDTAAGGNIEQDAGGFGSQV